jgi:uncharacterized membrane protein HdeD (DUF308 family)
MSALLRQRRTSSIIVALLSIILGVVLVIYPDKAANIFVMVCGYALIALGVYYAVVYFARKSKVAMLQMELLLGIVLLLVGIWMVTKPASVIALLQYVVGALIVIHGIIDLQASLNIKRAGFDKWGASLVLSLLTLALGALIIIDPFSATQVLMVVIGIVLVFDGLSDVYIIAVLSKLFKDVKEAVTEAEQEANAVETEGTVDDGKAADAPIETEGTPDDDSEKKD